MSGADDRVVVIGGGLAGITAALGLAEVGLQVTLLEARPWLGGATWSFGRRGLTIDNGQHVFLRCFTAYQELLTQLGVRECAPVQRKLDLTVLAPEGPLRLRRTAWPAPTHLATMLARYRPLTVAQRLSVLPAAMSMWLADLTGPDAEQASIGQWLRRHGQDEQMISRFWELFLVPFMNACAVATDQGTAAAFINTALLNRRDQADLGIASVPLRDLHAAPASRLLAQLGAQVRLGAQVAGVQPEATGGFVVRLTGDATPAGEVPGQLLLGDDTEYEIQAAAVVLAVPSWAAARIAPAELASDAAAWGQLTPAPIVSIHALYDTRVTELPYAAPVDSPLRWIADKTMAAGLHTGQYLAASVSSAGTLVDEPPAALRARMLPELSRLFPAAADAKVEDFFVTRERSATFLPAPGTRLIRPGQRTGLRGLALAGAWTDTGWPDTMEGAVRSGWLAAEAIVTMLAEARCARRIDATAVAEPAVIAEPDPTAAVTTDPAAAELAAGEPSEPEPAAAEPAAEPSGPEPAVAAEPAKTREEVVPRQVAVVRADRPDSGDEPAVRKLAAVAGTPDQHAVPRSRKQAGRRPDVAERGEPAARQ